VEEVAADIAAVAVAADVAAVVMAAGVAVVAEDGDKHSMRKNK
jgi:hypothetical protein